MTKQEQLKQVFKNLLTEVYFDSYDIKVIPDRLEKMYIEDKAEQLLKEVTIRTNL